MKKVIISVCMAIFLISCVDTTNIDTLVGREYLERDFEQPISNGEPTMPEGAFNQGYIKIINTKELDWLPPGSDIIHRMKYEFYDSKLYISNFFQPNPKSEEARYFQVSNDYASCTDPKYDTVYNLE